MRFINSLSSETIKLLQGIVKKSKYYRVRRRAHCILLSSQGYPVTELIAIFNVSQNTIYSWFNAWEKKD